ncbi:MAG: hypothetical protein ABI898_03905 [Sphingomonadales bacterium]
MTGRIVLALLAPFMLLGCVLTPGKFVSSLSINADRTFAFAYKGEVIAINPSTAMKSSDEATDSEKNDGAAKPDEAPAEDNDAKFRAMAESLSKEVGYRSVIYRGKGKFDIDYAITGHLDHGFMFPYNTDAEAVFPFLAVEIHQGGLVRVKAPGFANSKSDAMSGAAGGLGSSSTADAAKFLDGVFTIDTDAEIVSQNTEDGAKAAGKRKTISWKATPLTKDAPTAVIRVKP